MKVVQSDIRFLDEPAEYPFRDGTIAVTAVQLEIWKYFPHAEFEVFKISTRKGARYIFGSHTVELTGVIET
jgi:hypothetical protein